MTTERKYFDPFRVVKSAKPAAKITKGMVVVFKPEWQDAGDDKITFVAVDDEEKGRVTVRALLGLVINPTQVVKVSMIASSM